MQQLLLQSPSTKNNLLCLYYSLRPHVAWLKKGYGNVLKLLPPICIRHIKLSQCFSVLLLGPPCPACFRCFLSPSPSFQLQHTWSKWMGLYQASAELDDKLIIWIRCVGAGWLALCVPKKHISSNVWRLVNYSLIYWLRVDLENLESGAAWENCTELTLSQATLWKNWWFNVLPSAFFPYLAETRP